MVEPQRYRRVTSYCRSVQLLGYTVGSVLGQILVSLQLLSYHGITEFTLVLTSIALLTSFVLPMPQQSMFFHRKAAKEPERDGDGGGGGGPLEDGVGGEKGGGGGGNEDGGGGKKQVEGPAAGRSCGTVLLQLLQDFQQCYSSRQLLYWSVWWAMATCGYNQTVNYVQVTHKKHNQPNDTTQHDTTRHLTSVSLDFIGHKTVVGIWGRGVGEGGGEWSLPRLPGRLDWSPKAPGRKCVSLPLGGLRENWPIGDF